MKRIGIVGGLGPEATVDYYRIIVNEFRKKTKDRYPVVIIYSMDVAEFPCMLKQFDLNRLSDWLGEALHALSRAGAEFALIASNTPHIVFDRLQQIAPLPLISIVEETCAVAKKKGLTKLGLLGTKTTMSGNFFHDVFNKQGIAITVPNADEQDYIHDKLITEIMYNNIVPDTKSELLRIVKRILDEEAIQGIILGCTELPLMLTDEYFDIPFLNTTRIHAESAVRYSLGGT